MAIKTTPAIAKLINSGCELSARIKEDTVELKNIKEKLSNMEKGTYTTAKGGVVSVVKTKKYNPISPSDVEAELRKLRKGRDFFTVVKILVTPLRKVLPEKIVAKLQGASIGEDTRLSFK